MKQDGRHGIEQCAVVLSGLLIGRVRHGADNGRRCSENRPENRSSGPKLRTSPAARQRALIATSENGPRQVFIHSGCGYGRMITLWPATRHACRHGSIAELDAMRVDPQQRLVMQRPDWGDRYSLRPNTR
jgi:hypothetical protein